MVLPRCFSCCNEGDPPAHPLNRRHPMQGPTATRCTRRRASARPRLQVGCAGWLVVGKGGDGLPLWPCWACWAVHGEAVDGARGAA